MESQAEKLLDDEPSDTDYLGPHELIASAIAEVVRFQNGGKTIRLDGEWGAGKSTVVRLLEQRLVEPDTTMFVYDVWVHSGDPLRRVFLDSLLDALECKGWLGPNASNWEQRRATLSGRYKVTVERKKPTLNALSRLTPWAAWTLPFLFWIAQKLWNAPFPILSGMGIGPQLVLIAALTFISLAIWLSLKDDSIAFLLTRAPVEITTEKEDEPTATSLDFQKFFSDLMVEALGDQDGSRRLLIVVDNLDRVGTSEINDIWALLRSFLDNPAFQSEPWFRRLWVLVPVAKQLGVLKRSGDEPKGSPEEPVASNVQPGAPDWVFLDKVFQVKFELPPPSLKRWTKFLRKLCQDAFSNSTLEADAIVRLYVNETHGRVPTPRDLVRFVNDLVGMRLQMRLQWGQQFSLIELAAFTLSGTRDKVLEQVQQGQRPWERFEVIMGLARGTFEQAFRTLCLSVGNATAAMTPEYRTQIWNALVEGRTSDVVSALRQEGAGWVLDSLITELGQLSHTPAKLMNAFIVLDDVLRHLRDHDSAISEALPVTFIKDVEQACRHAMQAISRQDYEATNLVEGISAFLEIVGEVDGLQLVLMAVSQANAVDNRKAFEINFLSMLSIPSISDSLLAAQAPLLLPVSGEDWLELCYGVLPYPYIHRDNKERIDQCLKQCRPRDGWSSVEQALEQRIRTHVVDEVTLQALEDFPGYSAALMLRAILGSISRYSDEDGFRAVISVFRAMAKQHGITALRLLLIDNQLQPFLLDEVADERRGDDNRAFLLLLTISKMSVKTLDERGGHGVRYILHLLENPYAADEARFLNVLATEIKDLSCLDCLAPLAVEWPESREFVRCLVSRMTSDYLFAMFEKISPEQELRVFLQAIVGASHAETILTQYRSFLEEHSIWENGGALPREYDLGI